MRIVQATEARRAIAAIWFAESGSGGGQRGSASPSDEGGLEPAQLLVGDVTLQPHQLAAVHQLRDAIAEFGGALLCDEVGMGKTFVALALAHATARTLVIAPAALRTMWLTSAATAGRGIEFHSYESLSRGRVPHYTGHLVILDEAHHARNPATRRYETIAGLARNIAVLMLSATPIHNQRRELIDLLSVFLGARARSLSRAEIARCVIRRDRQSVLPVAGMPDVASPLWIDITPDEQIPELLLGLPPPAPPRGGGDGGALIIHSLLRQWASSDAALRGGLRRRLHRSIALVHALEEGVYPSARELEAWTLGDDSMQLAFPPLMAPAVAHDADLLSCVKVHGKGLREILGRLNTERSRDIELSRVLRELISAHPGEKIVAFSQYADTIDALFAMLSSAGNVAALTGRGGRVASSVISRDDALRRFAPAANGAQPPPRAESISLLLATDMLSEGVNLQDASVVVHLDLPWTPARLEQRTGRVARMGSPHATVHSYAVRPPASADTLIRLQATLRQKLIAAGEVAGHVARILPSFGDLPQLSPGPAILRQAVDGILRRWRDSMNAAPLVSHSLIAAVAGDRAGVLALCNIDHRLALIWADDGGDFTDDPAAIVAALKAVEGDDRHVSMQTAREIVRRVTAFVTLRMSLLGQSADSVAVGYSRRSTMRRISAFVESAPPHRRNHIAALANRARAVTLGRLGAAAERELEQLSGETTTCETWLLRIAELNKAPASLTPTGARQEVGEAVVAMFVVPPTAVVKRTKAYDQLNDTRSFDAADCQMPDPPTIATGMR